MNIDVRNITQWICPVLAAVFCIVIVLNIAQLGTTAVQTFWVSHKTAQWSKTEDEKKDEGKNTTDNPQEKKRRKKTKGKNEHSKEPSKYEALITRAPFGKKPEKGKPPLQLTAVIGDTAFINGKRVKIGDKVGDSVVVEIHGNKVVVEKDGKRKDIIMFSDLKGAPTEKSKVAPKKKENKPSSTERKKSQPRQRSEKRIETINQDDSIQSIMNEFKDAMEALDIDAVSALLTDDFSIAEYESTSQEDGRETLEQLFDVVSENNMDFAVNVDDIEITSDGEEATVNGVAVTMGEQEVTISLELRKTSEGWKIKSMSN